MALCAPPLPAPVQSMRSPTAGEQCLRLRNSTVTCLSFSYGHCARPLTPVHHGALACLDHEVVNKQPAHRLNAALQLSHRDPATGSGEVDQGVRVAKAAKDAGVSIFIWSGLPNTHKISKGKYVRFPPSGPQLMFDPSWQTMTWHVAKHFPPLHA